MRFSSTSRVAAGRAISTRPAPRGIVPGEPATDDGQRKAGRRPVTPRWVQAQRGAPTAVRPIPRRNRGEVLVATDRRDQTDEQAQNASRPTHGFLIRGHDLVCTPLTCASVSTAARFGPLVCSVWAPLSEECRPRSNIAQWSSMFGPGRPLRRVIAPGRTAVGRWPAARLRGQAPSHRPSRRDPNTQRLAGRQGSLGGAAMPGPCGSCLTPFGTAPVPETCRWCRADC